MGLGQIRLQLGGARAVMYPSAMGRLTDKVAIITGSARGTGESTARLFVEEGARVVVADVNEEGGRAVASSFGPSGHFARLDVTSEDSWQQAVETTVEHFGRVDILVNNAGLLKIAPIAETTAEDFDRIAGVNQKGVFLGIKSVAPAMSANGGGSIVNIASIDGMKGGRNLIVYSGTKWAVRGMTRVAAGELGRQGIRVNAVCPEAGGPEMIKPYLPDGIDADTATRFRHKLLSYQKDRSADDFVRDVALAVLFLASDESLSCTGSEIVVDSGILADRPVK